MIFGSPDTPRANYTQDAADDKTVKLLNSIEQLIGLLEEVT